MQDENMVYPDNNQAENASYSNQQEPLMGAQENNKEKKQIFTFSNISNIVLLAGLIVLYILFFTMKRSEEPKAPMALQKSGTKSLSVVFVNADSLNEKYEFVGVLKKNLEATGKRLQAEIFAEQSNFEKEAADFQKQVAGNTISEEKAKMEYESLMQKQQAIVEKKDRFTQQVADMELQMNLRLLDTITNFLKRYNQIYNFDYIMTYKTAGEILIANDTLDITNDVLRSLNKEYNERKK
jgi:outer membrane protein